MTAKSGPVLSKSRFLSGLQCAKRLWTEIHARQDLPTVDVATQARFAEGHAVGYLARELFPDGLEVGPGERRWDLVVPETQQKLAQRRPLYEAAFRYGAAACRVDLLVPVAKNHWDVLEVKSSTGVKNVHLSDLAFQAHVIEGTGLPVRDYYVVHLDTRYERDGELEIRALFHVERATEAVRELSAGVREQLEAMQPIARSAERPVIQIGRHCHEPYSCPLTAACWSFLPPQNVFDLVGGREKAFDFLSQGVLELRDIPGHADLDRRQRIQLEVARSGRPHVDCEVLAQFLSAIQHPVYYFDIETVASAIPRFDRSRPYQQIPFLFSVHRVESPGAVARHYAYMFESGGDPRPDFLRAVRSSLGDKGSIVAYNAPFERRVLEESVDAALPELEGWVLGLGDRFVDLLTPFRSFAFHHADQRGSASLKAVVTPLTSMSYSDLEISDGESASREYLRVMSTDVSAIERARVLRHLEAYCSLDTLAMVAIVKRLEQRLADA